MEQNEVSVAMHSVQELSEQKSKISLHLSELQLKIDEVASKLKKERESTYLQQ